MHHGKLTQTPDPEQTLKKCLTMPPYASNLIFEVFTESGESAQKDVPFVRVLYNGEALDLGRGSIPIYVMAINQFISYLASSFLFDNEKRFETYCRVSE